MIFSKKLQTKNYLNNNLLIFFTYINNFLKKKILIKLFYYKFYIRQYFLKQNNNYALLDNTYEMFFISHYPYKYCGQSLILNQVFYKNTLLLLNFKYVSKLQAVPNFFINYISILKLFKPTKTNFLMILKIVKSGYLCYSLGFRGFSFTNQILFFTKKHIRFRKKKFFLLFNFISSYLTIFQNYFFCTSFKITLSPVKYKHIRFSKQKRIKKRFFNKFNSINIMFYTKRKQKFLQQRSLRNKILKKKIFNNKIIYKKQKKIFYNNKGGMYYKKPKKILNNSKLIINEKQKKIFYNNKGGMYYKKPKKILNTNKQIINKKQK